ncbi:hypothetical protein LSTR_LSTR000064 [Laodelphax striatellus]|uniref:Uncharacterized protein n=1 Tax=Laodelphax striatellus TaxID=195883 RepID=A0A482X7G0_LAOST|nr:hypothetical protein LSTR_LSTR000064 [Laodelphax striatellus]
MTMRHIYLCPTLIFCLLVEEANSEFTSNLTANTTTEESQISLKLAFDNLQKIIVNDLKNNLANNDSMTSASPQTTNVSTIESEKNKLLLTLQTSITTENYSRASNTGETNNFGYSLEKRIEGFSKKENDSVISNVSKLLKGIIPNSYIFRSPGKDPFGFKRERTTRKPEYPLLKLFNRKTHGIIHKKRAGNLLKSKDSKGQKIESIFNDGEDAGSCENCSSILILINRNNNKTNDDSESIVQEVESLQPDKIAVIELKPRDEQSNSGDEISETISGSDSDSSQNAVNKVLREEFSTTVPANPMLIAMQSMKKCPSKAGLNTTSIGDSGARVLKSIDVDLKLKQELTVTGSLKLNYCDS